MKLICIVGPTASGKTKLGILLAKQYSGEVVSIDSMQIYKGMTIGTAAPAGAEMEGIPHHMVAMADPAENWSAARFVEEADRCVQNILSRGKRPILVGGTGLYLDALLAGRTFASGSAGGTVRAELSRQLAEGGIAPLLEELRRVDPESAQRLHPSDTKRILRALEVWRETGRTISQHNAETKALPPKYGSVKLGLAFRDREDMKALIDRRVDAMLAQGLLEEVRALADRDLPQGATALQAIGYKELLPALRGEVPLENAVEELKLRSRQYAKRQLTWLRRDKEIHWFLWEKSRDFAAACQNATEILTQEGIQ